MSSFPIDIAYRTSVEKPRPGALGSSLRWIADHPLAAGALCGLAVVLIAAAMRPAGVAAEPLIAAALSAMVILVWTVLFFLMRSFFDAQSRIAHPVQRRILIDDDHRASWLEDDEPRRRFDDATISLLTNPVPDAMGKSEGPRRKKATAWPVWIVIHPQDQPPEDKPHLVFETRDSATRARAYGAVPSPVIEATDERLPRAIAAPLLHRANDGEEA